MGTLRTISKVLSILLSILIAGIGAMIFYKLRAIYTDEPITTGVVVAAYGYGGSMALVFLAISLRGIKKHMGEK